GQHLQEQTLSQRDDRAGDGGVGGIGPDVAYEGLVDLQLVDWKAREIGQARITRSEIVDRKLQSHVVQSAEQAHSLLGLLHQQRLGDLQCQIARLEAGALQCFRNRLRQGASAELLSRQIDSNRQA